MSTVPWYVWAILFAVLALLIFWGVIMFLQARNLRRKQQNDAQASANAKTTVNQMWDSIPNPAPKRNVKPSEPRSGGGGSSGNTP